MTGNLRGSYYHPSIGLGGTAVFQRPAVSLSELKGAREDAKVAGDRARDNVTKSHGTALVESTTTKFCAGVN